MAHTVSPEKLAERLEVLREGERSGLFPRKFRAFGTLPRGQAALSVRYCAVLWGTSPQAAALTLKLLVETGEISREREGTRGLTGVPAVYGLTPLKHQK